MQKPATDIISLPIEITSAISDTKFRLVHIASQRVRQLADGAPAIVATRSIKDTTIALEEALTASFRVITGDDARIAKDEYRKRQEQARQEELLSAKEEEIRKELSAYLSEAQVEDLGADLGIAGGDEDVADDTGSDEDAASAEDED